MYAETPCFWHQLIARQHVDKCIQGVPGSESTTEASPELAVGWIRREVRDQEDPTTTGPTDPVHSYIYQDV